jgi:apolipoprotein D and lipocalin family protein
MTRKRILAAFFALAAAGLWAKGSREPFQAVVDHVELERFLGSWYVIGVNPTVFEKGATNGIETYSLDPSGNVRVEYVFYKGDPGGKKVTMHQKGRIIDKSNNSHWEVQPLWPFWFPYLIIDLADDYRYAVIGTNNYKNVWIMARSPTLSERDYEGILARLAARGYEVDRIQRMRQSW